MTNLRDIRTVCAIQLQIGAHVYGIYGVFLQKYIHDRLASRRHAGLTASGFDTFADICFDAGIVKTFLQITMGSTTIEKWPALSAHFALQSMWMLMRKGSVEERDDLLKELLEHDIVEFCLEVGPLSTSCRDPVPLNDHRLPKVVLWLSIDKGQLVFSNV